MQQAASEETALAANTPERGAAAPAEAEAESEAESEAVPVLQSDALLQGHKRVHIAHNGACYQLQATRQGKLILTK